MKDFSRRTFAKGVAVALAFPAVGVELLAKQSIPKIVSKREPMYDYAGVFLGYWWVTKDRLFHREDGPAIEYVNGSEYWYQNGERHRLDGPAVVWDESGYKEWWVEGKRHRSDGPAVVWDESGYKEWWVEGKRHRLDGPAVEWFDGTKDYWYEGKKLPLLSKRATLIQIKEREKNLFT